MAHGIVRVWPINEVELYGVNEVWHGGDNWWKKIPGGVREGSKIKISERDRVCFMVAFFHSE